MGFKIRAGLALGGAILSYLCGLNFLSGIASHLDTTGNVLVDIADGIGFVSKGIEALEAYLDPDTGQDAASTTPVPPVPMTTENLTPVICKKGRCSPYDPSKDKVLQQQLIRAERERLLQQFQNGNLPADSLVAAAGLFDKQVMDDVDMDNHPVAKKLKAAAALQQQKQIDKSDKSSKVSKEAMIIKVPAVDILDPANPSLEDSVASTQDSGWQSGFRRILASVSRCGQKLSNLILKVVAKVFPWNRRARTRLDNPTGQDDGAE